MVTPLSNDLRFRVVMGIEGGLSRRSAAAKFAVSVSSAVRWHQRYRRSGKVDPDAIGGDRVSHRVEAYAEMILGWVDAEPDLSIPEIRERLVKQGYQFASSTLWRLLQRHGYTYKKRQRMQASRNAKML